MVSWATGLGNSSLRISPSVLVRMPRSEKKGIDVAKVLAIEADPELRSLVCLILTDDGHNCAEFDPESHESSCLAAVRDFQPDVLVVGVATPLRRRESRAGLKCLEEVGRAGEARPTVAYSLSADQILARTLQRQGYVVWRRPFEDTEELCRLVGEAAGKGSRKAPRPACGR